MKRNGYSKVVICLMMIFCFFVLTSCGKKNTIEFITGCDATIPPQIVKKGSKIVEPKVDLSKEGYDFVGWYNKNNPLKKWNFDEDTVQDDLVLEANWSLKNQTLKIIENNELIYENNFGHGSLLPYSELSNALSNNNSNFELYRDIELKEQWNIEVDVITEPMNLFVKRIPKIIKSGAGGNYSVVLTPDGLVYTFGEIYWNAFTTPKTKPRLIEELSSYFIVDIMIGNSYVLLISQDGEVFCVGITYLHFGHPEYFKISDNIAKLKLPEGVKIVNGDTSDNHTVLVSSEGDVYTFGKNEVGQLGLGHNKIKSGVNKVELPSGVKISKAVAGRDYTVLLSETGEVYSFGLNSEGALGDGTLENRNSPVKTKIPDNVKIVDIDACIYTAYISEDGKVYTSGRSILGIDNNLEYTTQPVIAKECENVVVENISVSYRSTLIVTKDGFCYGIGYNGLSQLGILVDQDNYFPTKDTLKVLTRVPIPKDKLISSVSMGMSHSIFITRDGYVYTAGTNVFGSLGLENDSEVIVSPYFY